MAEPGSGNGTRDNEPRERSISALAGARAVSAAAAGLRTDGRRSLTEEKSHCLL